MQFTRKFSTPNNLLSISIIVLGILLAMLALIGYIWLESNAALNLIVKNVLPVTTVTQKLAVTSIELNSEIPDVLNAKDHTELSAKYNNLLDVINKQTAFLKNLSPVYQNENYSKELLDLIDKATGKLIIVNDYMSNILWNKELERKLSLQLTEKSNKFILQITELTDDAFFELVVNHKTTNQLEQSSQPVNTTKQKTQSILSNHYQIANQLILYNTLLEIKADGILAIGILETAIHHKDVDELIPLKERFESTSINLNEGLKVLLKQDKAKYKSLIDNVKDLLAFNQGKENCFSLREAELRYKIKIEEIANDLKPIGIRMEEVKKLLLFDVVKNIDKLNAFKSQYKKLILSVIIALTFLIVTFVACLLFVYKNPKNN